MLAPCLLPLPHLHSLLKQDGVCRLRVVGVIILGPSFPPHLAVGSADPCTEAGGLEVLGSGSLVPVLLPGS